MFSSLIGDSMVIPAWPYPVMDLNFQQTENEPHPSAEIKHGPFILVSDALSFKRTAIRTLPAARSNPLFRLAVSIDTGCGCTESKMSHQWDGVPWGQELLRSTLGDHTSSRHLDFRGAKGTPGTSRREKEPQPQSCIGVPKGHHLVRMECQQAHDCMQVQLLGPEHLNSVLWPMTWQLTAVNMCYSF